MTNTFPTILRALLAAAALSWQLAGAQTIFMSSPPAAVNLTSDGKAMGNAFRFELGVFEGSFIPTSENLAQWSANWRAIQRLGYDSSTKRYAGAFTPSNNTSPFTIGKQVYVWGFKGNPAAAEWILLRAPTWTFPNANPLNPPAPNAYEWLVNGSGVTAVVGSVHAAGSPFLMRSANIRGYVLPPTNWGQWRADSLAGEKLDGPNDDPDGDGISNQLEFALGRDPRKSDSSPAMALTLADIGGDKHLEIRVPRRKDHVSSLAVEVSSDLSTWNDGANFVEVIDDGADALLVRDRTPNPQGGRRFVRLRATVPAP